MSGGGCSTSETAEKFADTVASKSSSHIVLAAAKADTLQDSINLINVGSTFAGIQKGGG
jgi:hypothetical protein